MDISRRIYDSIMVMSGLDTVSIGIVGRQLQQCLADGAKIMTLGNGGSHAHASHLTAELMGRYLRPDRAGLPSVCLSADQASITAIANDFGYNVVFARQIKALADSDLGDMVVMFSTSGNSQNIIDALYACKEVGVKSVLITSDLCVSSVRALPTYIICVGSEHVPLIQEAHQVILHVLMECIEEGCR